MLTDVIRNISMFKAEPTMIKAQIEQLINNDFIMRDDIDKRMLIYVP